MNRARVERARAFLRIEETVTELLYCAEQFDANLLEAGRNYGAALQSLARRR